MAKWKCNKCGKEMDKLVIHWGMSTGQKVDILDYFCQHCPSDSLTFEGTLYEKDAYWNMEWKDGQ